MVRSLNRRSYIKGIVASGAGIGLAGCSSGQETTESLQTEQRETNTATETQPTPMPTDTDYAPVVEQAAVTGSAVAANLFRRDIEVEYKDDTKANVVTKADRGAQAAIMDTLERLQPDATIVGEEGDAAKEVPDSGLSFVVDPLDGSYNFTRGNRLWCASVAAVEEGEPVAAASVAPALDDAYVGTPEGVRRNGEPVSVSDRTDPSGFMVAPTYFWGFDSREQFAVAARAVVERFSDLRRVGSTQLALALVAAGEIEAAITNLETNPWDTIAGAAMVEWAGGTVTDLNGDAWGPDSTGLVASNGGAHDLVLEATQEIEAAKEN
ncbi:inositol monophosphatase [Halorhabdus sp. CBA1104]|uniref:inositol monophosphatase family protein n=1 Tax=unclassified Halorhabdus TaxID=2621901 RepID=UPI00351A19B1